MKSQLQQLQYLNKYSRFSYEKGRREKWTETVLRVVNHLGEMSSWQLDESVYDEIHDAILNQRVMPSMRLLATAGEAAKRNEISGYNCGFRPVTSPMDMAEIMYILMSGTGMGYSVETHYIEQLPVVKRQEDITANTWEIEDSAEGWFFAFSAGLQSWFNGFDLEFDYSKIRPAGAILKTKGGRSSGFKPLKKLLGFSRSTILNAQGRKLTSLEVHDIVTTTGECIVSGGHRRSAMLALFSEDDHEMMTCKNGDTVPTNRYNANNSVVWKERKTLDEIRAFMMEMDRGKRGEPGFFSRAITHSRSPERWSPGVEAGTNACQPAFATVLTPNGIRQFSDIDAGSIIWSGDQWTKVVKKWASGIKPVYRYSSSFGEFVGTENHRILQDGKKIEARYADSFDARAGIIPDTDLPLSPVDIMDGLVIGDGSIHKASNNLVYLTIGKNDQDYFQSEIADLLLKDRKAGFGADNIDAFEVNTTIKHTELPLVRERLIPNRFIYGDSYKIRGFLRGLFSANGSVIANGGRVSLKQTSHEMIRAAQLMLSSIGIRSYITINKPKMIEWDNGVYETRQSYDLNITRDRYIFAELIGFIQQYKNDAISGGTIQKDCSGILQSVEYLGIQLVYDITVDCDEHVYWTGGVQVSNCGEIELRSAAPNPYEPDGGDPIPGGQFCNLSSVIARPHDTLETLQDKVRLATIIGTIQSMADNFPLLQDGWRLNAIEERLLGVDLNGIFDCPVLFDATVDELATLREHAKAVNRIYAEQLGINPSASVTCVKPSGNASVLLDTSSGIHPRYAPFYLRRVRLNQNDPVLKLLEAHNYPVEPAPEGARTMVASFPVASPGGKSRDDITAIEHLDLWLRFKTGWTTHNPSATIYYGADELDDVIQWIYDNQDYLGGLSFLPRSDHKYDLAPYEEITREEYDKYVELFPEIDFSRIVEFESEDNTTLAQELACFAGAGSCEI